VVPRAEECNDDDDACDGENDEALAEASCETGLAGVCGEGNLVCVDGRSMCKVLNAVSPEVCDGKDNDCNGETDDGAIAAVPCYPENKAGCTVNSAGVYECIGACKAGVSRCENGMMLDCEGAVPPNDMELCGLVVGGTGA